MGRAEGIDVSHHHPVLNFTDVMNAGIQFFGAKATEGRSYRDPTFRAHRDGARAHPFVLAVYYHFAKGGDPVKEAGHLLDVAGELRANERLALDIEGPDAPGVPWIDSFVGELVRVYPDRRPLIYTSARIWHDMLGSPSWPAAIVTDLWAPRYGPNEPNLPLGPVGVAKGQFPIWPRWTFWQDSESFACPGVAGPCDHNVFRGDVDELRAYAKLAGT